MPDNAKSDYYEKVRCVSDDPAKSHIGGKLAAVLGRAQHDDGSWSYAIHVYGERYCFSVLETELESTGEFARREEFYSGASIRVSQDGHIPD